MTDAATPKMTDEQAALVADALVAGYTVTFTGGIIDIFKGTASRITRGIRIYEDGTRVRLDVDPEIAKRIRSYAECRAILRIGAHND